MSESGAKKFEARKKSENDSLHSKHSTSLWSVPSIFVDNGETPSNLSLADISSISEDEPSVKSIDPETISMIVRNVEALEGLETRRDYDDIDWNLDDIELPTLVEQAASSDQKVGSPKKHDLFHGLKDSIQEKFHHLSDNIKKHDMMPKESPPREHGKIFHDLKENVSGKIHQIAEKMHHFHLPHMPHHQQESSENGLVSQAMQTILMEKFNIVEASSALHSTDTMQKRKSSSSSLQSIKQKFNLFQRPRRSVEMQSETSSLKSISEIQATGQPEKTSDEPIENKNSEIDFEAFNDDSSILELPIHEDPGWKASNDSLVTVLSHDKSIVSKEELKVSVVNFDSILSVHKPLANNLADTNKAPLHASLLSLSRNELSTSPGGKMHARTESIGCKFPASPAKNVSGSLGKDQTLSAAHRRSSDSDLSITPKGEYLFND